MLNNVKIKYKVALGFFLVILVAVFVVIYTMGNIRRIDRDYSYLMNTNDRVYIMLQIPTDIANLRRLITTVAFRTGETEFLVGLEQDIGQVHVNFLGRIDEFRENVTEDTSLSEAARSRYFQQMDELERLINYYISDIVAPTLVAAYANEMEVVLSFGVAGVPVVAEMTAIYGSIIELSKMHVNETHAALNSQARLSRIIGTVISLIGLGVGIAATIVITASISRPLSKVVKVLRDVSNGRLNANIDRQNISKDEIGELTGDVANLVDVIKSMVDDLSKAHDEYISLGNARYTIENPIYKNAFADAIGLVNKLLSQTASDIISMVDVLKQIGDGDFSMHMNVNDWPGEWVVLPQAVGNLTDNLKAIRSEMGAMIDATANKGDLSFQINADMYKGDWHNLMAGLNSIAKAVDAPLKVIKVSLDVMKSGIFEVKELDKQLIARGLDTDTSNYKGDFNYIAVAVEDTITAISSYINELEDMLAKMANGDLSNKISREYVGSFDLIKQSVNNISISLNKTMSEIFVASDQVLSGARQISNSAAELANGAQEQASAVEELNATIDIIGQQTHKNADNSSEAHSLSDKSVTSASEGNESMKHMLVAMSQIKESSKSISAIVKTIQDIAFQTNLLALNASVEAARAGEHGRGFAVVAEEVRNLAGRSQVAATETTSLIDDSISRVEIGSNIAESTSQSLDAIVKNASAVLGSVNNIAAASKEQLDAIAQVGEGLMQISMVVQSNSAVSQETAAASQELNSQAEVLKQLVAYFKL